MLSSTDVSLFLVTNYYTLLWTFLHIPAYTKGQDIVEHDCEVKARSQDLQTFMSASVTVFYRNGDLHNVCVSQIFSNPSYDQARFLQILWIYNGIKTVVLIHTWGISNARDIFLFIYKLHAKCLFKFLLFFQNTNYITNLLSVICIVNTSFSSSGLFLHLFA